MQGEALFNDGVGVVLFVLLLGFAAGSGDASPSAKGVAITVLHEVGGGLLLGVIAGYAAYRAMRAIDDFAVKTLITLALVSGLYALAQRRRKRTARRCRGRPARRLPGAEGCDDRQH